MKKPVTPQHITGLWETAVERALEKESQTKQAQAQELDHAVGLHTKSGVRAGIWGDNTAAVSGCTGQCGTYHCG